MKPPEDDGVSAPEVGEPRFDFENIGLKLLSGQPLGFRLRQAGLLVLGSDVDEGAGVAAVWLARHPGAPDSMQRTLLFERSGEWRYLGGSGGSGRKVPLAGRQSVLDAGPAAIITPLSGCSVRSRADREALSGPGDAGSPVGWVASARFRLATEVACLRVAERQIMVPPHGYVIVSWKAPPARGEPVRPPIAAIGADGSQLTELGAGSPMDAVTMAAVQAAIADG